jgi:hypothetical protein
MAQGWVESKIRLSTTTKEWLLEQSLPKGITTIGNLVHFSNKSWMDSFLLMEFFFKVLATLALNEANPPQELVHWVGFGKF